MRKILIGLAGFLLSIHGAAFAYYPKNITIYQNIAYNIDNNSQYYTRNYLELPPDVAEKFLNSAYTYSKYADYAWNNYCMTLD